jgi:Spy/CpxP family protein refolding chaperone
MKAFSRILFVSVLLAVSVAAFGQNNGMGDFARQWQERIESEKIAFLTNEMSLTPKEAQTFWPIYNQAQKEQREAIEASMKAFGELDKAVRDGKTGSEINTLLDKYTKAIDGQDVSAKYLKEYLKVLPAEKVAKLFLGEEKFRQSQINRLRQPMGGGQPMGQPGGFGNGNRRQQKSDDKK